MVRVLEEERQGGGGGLFFKAKFNWRAVPHQHEKNIYDTDRVLSFSSSNALVCTFKKYSSQV
jgi:hypothetical protein